MSRPGSRSRARTVVGLLVGLGLLAGACTGTASSGVEVRPIEDILASDIVVEPDPSGTFAVLRVRTTIPTVCAVVYGVDDSFGSIATDDDMAGGAHEDHQPRMTGLQPDTEYRFVLQGSDADGNLYRSDVMTFRTPPASGAPPPGVNIVPRSLAIEASSEFSSGFAAVNAGDGDLGTEWSSAGDGDGAWIAFDLGQPTDIVGVRWLTRQMSDGTAVVNTFSVTVDGEVHGPYTADDVVPLQVHGQLIRFDAVGTTGGNTGAVEIEVYATDPG